MRGRGRNLAEPRDEITLDVRAAAPQRLDLYAWSTLNWKSRTRLQSLIRSGKIRLNGEVVKPSRRVKRGDRVTIFLSRGIAPPPDYDSLGIEVVYEDPWLVAVNKPSALLVHPVGRHVYDTLINYLHHRYWGRMGEGEEKVIPRLCHRIDKETTGLLLVAKEAYTHREIMAQFESRQVSKEYLALVEGDYPAQQGTLVLPIGEGRSLEGCLEHEVLKESSTTVRVLKRLGAYTLLACVPHTGRQNQIRVHLAATGHPIVGDARYGAGPRPEGFPPRYLLHSSALRFYHPRLKCPVELGVPPPADFQALLRE